MTVILSLTTILLLMLSISLHELGHAFSMRKYKVPIEEISLLGVGKTLFSFKWRKIFGETPLFIKLFPIGAYVSPGEKGAASMEMLTVHQKCDIYSAGVFMNLFFSAVLSAWVILSQNLFLESEMFHLSWIGLVFVPVTYLLYHFRKYTYPIQVICGVVILGFLLHFMATHFMESVTSNGSIVSIGAQIVSDSKSISKEAPIVPLLVVINKAILKGASLSIALAIMNILPISMLDGGRILSEWMKVASRKFPILSTPVTVFKVLGTLLLVFLITTALWGDISLIFRGIWNLFT